MVFKVKHNGVTPEYINRLLTAIGRETNYIVDRYIVRAKSLSLYIKHVLPQEVEHVQRVINKV